MRERRKARSGREQRDFIPLASCYVQVQDTIPCLLQFVRRLKQTRKCQNNKTTTLPSHPLHLLTPCTFSPLVTPCFSRTHLKIARFSWRTHLPRFLPHSEGQHQQCHSHPMRVHTACRYIEKKKHEKINIMILSRDILERNVLVIAITLQSVISVISNWFEVVTTCEKNVSKRIIQVFV